MKKYNKKRGWVFPFGDTEMVLPYDGKEYATPQAMADQLPNVVYLTETREDTLYSEMWGKVKWFNTSGVRAQVKCAGTSIPGWRYQLLLKHGGIEDLDVDEWNAAWKVINEQ